MLAITVSKPELKSKPKTLAWHVVFLKMLPTIESYASRVFSFLKHGEREEAVQAVVAHCLVGLLALYERDRLEVAHPLALAKYGACRVRAGRQVGSRSNINDVLSRYAQYQRGFEVTRRHDKSDRNAGIWHEALVEDRSAGPAEIAATRIDFADWLASLPDRDRRIAESLAVGNSTLDVASIFGLSSGRISQLRRKFMDSWSAFHGGPEVAFA